MSTAAETSTGTLSDGPARPSGRDGEYAGLRRRVRGDEPLTGTFVSVNAPAVVEMIGLAGFDSVCLDAEHAAYGLSELEQMVRAAELRGIDPGQGARSRCRHLAGARRRGSRRPSQSPEQAAEAVSLARYPGDGRRGAGPGRASGYGAHLGRTLSESNAAVAVLAQVETRAGLDRAAEIAATPGLDCVFVGPGDLAVSLGVAPGSPEHLEAVEQAIAAARRVGQRTGIFVADPGDIPAYCALGVTVFVVQSDSMFLLSRAGEIHRAAAAACRAGLVDQ